MSEHIEICTFSNWPGSRWTDLDTEPGCSRRGRLLFTEELEKRYNLSYTASMKTAISIPDKVFEAAEKAAKRLGVSRSELYVNAIQEYLAQHSDEHVTEELNNIYSSSKVDGQLDSVLRKMQSSSLNGNEW